MTMISAGDTAELMQTALAAMAALHHKDWEGARLLLGTQPDSFLRRVARCQLGFIRYGMQAVDRIEGSDSGGLDLMFPVLPGSARATQAAVNAGKIIGDPPLAAIMPAPMLRDAMLVLAEISLRLATRAFGDQIGAMLAAPVTEETAEDAVSRVRWDWAR